MQWRRDLQTAFFRTVAGRGPTRIFFKSGGKIELVGHSELNRDLLHRKTGIFQILLGAFHQGAFPERAGRTSCLAAEQIVKCGMRHSALTGNRLHVRAVRK